MKNSFTILISLFTLTSLTACNLFSGLSSPSNDEQYLVAARACLDRGDYVCALDNYKALSNSYADVKVNETSLALLAQAKIFSFSDLIGSLGTSLGSGSSFATMANLLAARGANTPTNQVFIQKIYTDNNAISNSKLKAFSKFVTALSMLNIILASAAGGDTSLTAADLVADPATCPSATGPLFTGCEAPGNNLVDSDPADPSSMAVALGWDGAPSLQKLLKAADAADQQAALFSGSTGSGIFASLSTIAGLAGGPAAVRQQLLTILNLH